MTKGSDALRPSPDGSAEHAVTRFAQIFLLVIALWLVALGLFNVLHPSDWAMGDWLINYAGGFVRRGLLGQIALLLRSAHIPPLPAMLLLQWALYAAVLATMWRVASSVRWTWWTAAFFFSPATLAFALQDPPFAFRKEILFFALLAYALAFGKPQDSKLRTAEDTAKLWPSYVLLLTLGCAVCILSHEALLVFFPYLFAAVYLRSRNLRWTVTTLVLPVVVSVTLFALVSHFPGNARVAQAVCTSIGGTLTTPPSGLCGGAIDYLAHDSAYAHHEVVRVMLAGRYWTRVPWLFLLPLVPAGLGLAQLWRADRKLANVLLCTTTLAWLLSVSVFYYGTDWTRWIYIHSFSLMMLMLLAQRRSVAIGQNSTSVLFEKGSPRRWIAWALLLMYCLGWELSVYGQRPLYGGFVRYVTHNMARGQQ